MIFYKTAIFFFKVDVDKLDNQVNLSLSCSHFNAIALLASSFDLVKNQKRWVVIGICLNRVLLPVLRDFVGQEIPKHYTSLKTARGIDTQVFKGHLIHDGPFQLNYGSINNNWGNFKKKVRSYDYKVGTSDDFAKLYLEPHMAKFTGTKGVPSDLSFLTNNACEFPYRSFL